MPEHSEDNRDRSRHEARAEPVEEPDTAGPVRKRSGEVGGRDGPDPTRYGDWEKDGRCIDF